MQMNQMIRQHMENIQQATTQNLNFTNNGITVHNFDQSPMPNTLNNMQAH